MPTSYTEAGVRHELIEQLSRARQQTDDLFAIVNADSLYERFALRTAHRRTPPHRLLYRTPRSFRLESVRTGAWAKGLPT
jgi:hypothetical protein